MIGELLHINSLLQRYGLIGADAIQKGLETKTRAGGEHGLIGRDDLFNSES
jgi:hypothetical protein